MVETEEPDSSLNSTANDVADPDDSIPAEDLTCSICAKTFAKVDNLVIHLTSNKHRRNITADNKYIAAHLYTRYHTELLKRSAYQCACCRFAAVQHGDLLAHMKSQQHNELSAKLAGPLECAACSFLDYDGTRMLSHCLSEAHCLKADVGSIVIKEKKSKIKCLECGKVLHSSVHYTRHLRSKHRKVNEPGTKLKTCNYCSFEGKVSALSQHMTRTHRNERPHSCTLCQSHFHSKYDLCKHYATKKHVEQVLDSYKQSIVSANVTQSLSLFSTTSAKNTMRCNFCRFVTCELSQLQGHYTSQHEDECADDGVQCKMSGSPVFCRYCLKQAPNKQQLYPHEIGHIEVT